MQYSTNAASKIKDAIQISYLYLVHFVKPAVLKQYKRADLIHYKSNNPCHR